MNRILGAARDLAGKVDRLVDGDRAKSPTRRSGAHAEQELRHELRTAAQRHQRLRRDAARGCSQFLQGDPLRADFDRLLAAVNRPVCCVSIAFVRFSVDVEETSLAPRSEPRRGHGERLECAASGQSGRMLSPKPAPFSSWMISRANRDLLSRRLTRDGHRVASVAGGQQALQALVDDEIRTSSCLDLMMPDINGLDVLVRMKADERLRRIPVIISRPLAETESAVRCIEAGAEDICPKPFDPVLLRARINACLHKKRWRDREQKYLRRIEDETAKFERLLLTILPRQVIGRLNQGEAMIADRFEGVSVSVPPIW